MIVEPTNPGWKIKSISTYQTRYFEYINISIESDSGRVKSFEIASHAINYDIPVPVVDTLSLFLHTYGISSPD